MRRVLILLLVFASISTAVAHGRTLTCTSDVQSRVACIVEQRVAAIGPFEFSVGVDTLAAHQSHVAPYLLVSYFGAAWSAWFELAMPSDWPIVGRSNPIRIGFSVTW